MMIDFSNFALIKEGKALERIFSKTCPIVDQKLAFFQQEASFLWSCYFHSLLENHLPVFFRYLSFLNLLDFSDYFDFDNSIYSKGHQPVKLTKSIIRSYFNRKFKSMMLCVSSFSVVLGYLFA